MRYMILISLLWSCDRSDKEELIDRVRPLGIRIISSNPIPKPGQPLEIELVVAAPKANNLSVDIVSDPEKQPAKTQALNLSRDPAQDFTKEYDKLKIQHFRAKFDSPPEAIFGPRDSLRIYYELKLRSDGYDKFVRQEHSSFKSGDALTWAKVDENSISITVDAKVGQAKDIDIEGAFTRAQGYEDTYKINWFVDRGTIENFQAKKTKWTTPKESGKALLIFTFRAKKSRDFAYKVQEVEIE